MEFTTSQAVNKLYRTWVVLVGENIDQTMMVLQTQVKNNLKKQQLTFLVNFSALGIVALEQTKMQEERDLAIWAGCIYFSHKAKKICI